MPVVIGELEQIVDTPRAEESAEQPAASGPTPLDIERALRFAMERAARLRAH